MVSAAAWRSSPDLSSDTLGALQTLMLAQAQKNFVEKAQADGMSDKILALLNAECAGLYEEVGRRFDEAKARQRPISAMAQEWLDVVEWNRKVFDGMQHLAMAKVADAEHKYGDALSRHTYAANKTAEAVKAARGRAAGSAGAVQARRTRSASTPTRREARQRLDLPRKGCRTSRRCPNPSASRWSNRSAPPSSTTTPRSRRSSRRA